MGNAHGMTISDGIHDWSDGIRSLFFTVMFLFHDSVKKLKEFNIFSI